MGTMDRKLAVVEDWAEEGEAVAAAVVAVG